MKKSILIFTILLFLFSVNIWARTQKTTEQFGKTERTLPEIVKSQARPTFKDGETPRRLSRTMAAPIDENYNPVNRQERDGVAIVWEDDFETEGGLFYYDDAAYIWTAPDEMQSYAVRYTPFHGGTLDGAYFYFYGGDATAVDIHVWADDGSGYPGASLGSLTALPVTVGGWFYADLTSLAISVVGTADFFISFEVNGAGSIQLISSAGADASGVNRSLVWDGSAWVYGVDDPYVASDVEWCMDAIITFNDPWISTLGKWQLQTDPVAARQDTAHSPTHCWWADESITGFYKDYLTSPVFTLDADESYDIYNLSLWVDIEFMRSTAGGTSIDEYYEVYIADVDAVPTDWWHIDDFNGYDANSWWCGTDSLAGWVGGWGYGNSWNQWIQTPAFTLPSTTGLNLDFMERHDSEPGYDICYVEASIDGWNNIDLLASYDDVANTWSAVNISLDAYAGETVALRFRFESDTGYSDEDGLYLSEGGWFIDDVVVSDASRAIYFQDNADDEVNFIVNQGNFDWTQLFYDYDRDYPAASNGWEVVDGSTIFNGTCNVTPYAGKNVQFQVTVGVDDSTYVQGAGLYIDDISIEGIALPEFDILTDVLVVPYPQTEADPVRSVTTPKIIYHQAGFSTSAPNAACDIEGLGNDYPANDYFGLSMPGVAMGDYALGELQYQSPTFDGLEAGVYNYKGWCDGAFEEPVRGDTFAPDVFVEVYPPGEYELGYNSRIDGNFYYPACTGAVVLYTPFTDGVFAAPDTYDINGISHMIYSRGTDFDGDCLTFTVYDYDPLTPLQFGTELYSEEICFNITADERFTWLEIPFSTPVTVTDDYWLHVTGDFINYPGGAPNEPGYFVYSMLVDSETLFEDQLGANFYAGHSYNWAPDVRYTLTEYPSNYYINCLINTDVPSTLNEPLDVTVTEDAGTITLSWDAVRFATGYYVYSDTDPYGAFTTNETQFGVGTLTWGESTSDVKKFYRVKAYK